MNFKMVGLRGINQDYAEKLRAAGIETTDDMMRLWNDTTLRASVREKTGMDDAQLTRLVSVARMARMKGVGPKYADLLVSAGITGRRSLSAHTPKSLVERLAAVNGVTRPAVPLPSLAEVGTWFAELTPVEPSSSTG